MQTEGYRVPQRRLVILLSCLNLAVITIFLLDNFITTREQTKIISGKNIERSSSRRITDGSHLSYILTDNDSHRYNVSEPIYEKIAVEDSVRALLSLVFGRPEVLRFRFRGEENTVRTGILNASVIGPVLCLLSIAVYWLLLFRPSVLGNSKNHLPVALVCTWLAVIVGIFYYCFQP